MSSAFRGIPKSGSSEKLHDFADGLVSLNDNGDTFQRIQVAIYVNYRESLTARMRPSYFELSASV